MMSGMRRTPGAMSRAFRGRARPAEAFFRMALTEAAADATALGYVPLPDPVVPPVLAGWRDPAR
jgi:hypothetical protein